MNTNFNELSESFRFSPSRIRVVAKTLESLRLQKLAIEKEIIELENELAFVNKKE